MAAKIKPVFVAVDTNVLIDQAGGNENVLDALEIIRRRFKDADFIVTPTVIEELGEIYATRTGQESDLAYKALKSLLSWGYTPAPIPPVGMGIAEQIGLKLRLRNVIPDEEKNDALVIAEAAFLDCSLLLTSDAHLLTAQESPLLLKILRESHVDGDELVIGSPRTIAKRFY